LIVLANRIQRFTGIHPERITINPHFDFSRPDELAGYIGMNMSTERFDYHKKKLFQPSDKLFLYGQSCVQLRHNRAGQVKPHVAPGLHIASTFEQAQPTFADDSGSLVDPWTPEGLATTRRVVETFWNGDIIGYQ
jgi:hypothetical protein